MGFFPVKVNSGDHWYTWLRILLDRWLMNGRGMMPRSVHNYKSVPRNLRLWRSICRLWRKCMSIWVFYMYRKITNLGNKNWHMICNGIRRKIDVIVFCQFQEGIWRASFNVQHILVFLSGFVAHAQPLGGAWFALSLSHTHTHTQCVCIIYST